MFPHPELFYGRAETVVYGVAAVAKFFSNDHRFTRRWRSPASPGIRSAAWKVRMEYVQHLVQRISRRIDLTEISSRGLDDGLPSRQSSRLRGLRDVAQETANTIRRRILSNRNVCDRQGWWEMVEQLEEAADQLEALAFGEFHVHA